MGKGVWEMTRITIIRLLDWKEEEIKKLDEINVNWLMESDNEN